MIIHRNPFSLALLTLAVGFTSFCESVPNTCVPPELDDACDSTYPFCPNPVCKPCCFCIPNGNGDCPLKKLEKLELNNVSLLPAFLALHAIWDEDKSDIDGFIECQPYEAVGPLVGEDQCALYSSIHENTEVCAFVYDTSECTYSYKTFKNRGQVQRLGSHAVITHEGHCGACSSAQDLAAYLNPALAIMSYTCGMAGYSSGPPYDNYSSFEDAYKCFRTPPSQDPLQQGGPGFTDDCAYVWASNAANSALPNEDRDVSCTNICVDTFGDTVPPTSIPNQFNDANCDLVDCINCDEERSGELFKMFAGRTRRNSGILTSFQNPATQYWYGLKRPCKDIAAITQYIPDDFFQNCLSPPQ